MRITIKVLMGCLFVKKFFELNIIALFKTLNAKLVKELFGLTKNTV